MLRNENCNLCTFGINSERVPKNICLIPLNQKQTDVMVIAESPSTQEDVFNKVFGSKILSDVRSKFKNADIPIYCTYVVKCLKPHKETKIDKKQIKPCSTEYLQKEIGLVKPKHIIVLGANALSALGKSGFKNKQSNREWDNKLNAYIYTTVHHLQANYSVDAKRNLMRDLDRYISWIKDDGVHPLEFNPPVSVADTLESLRILQRKIKQHNHIAAVDIETNSLNPFSPTYEVRSIQFCYDPLKGGVFVPLALEHDCYYTDTKETINFWTEETLKDAVDIIREILATTKCIWHNGTFDRKGLYMWGKNRFGKPIEAPKLFMDTIIAGHILNENRELGLKRLITTVLGYPTYNIADKLTKDLDILIPYASKDTVATYLLANIFTEELNLDENKKVKKLYTKFLKRADMFYTRLELRGWPSDIETAKTCLVDANEEYKTTVTQILDYLKNEDIEFLESDLTKSRKLADVIFNKLKLPIAKDIKVAYTKTGQLCTNQDALFHLKDHPFVILLFHLKHLLKAISTYIRPFLEMTEARGRLTTNYKLFGTTTGRTASSKDKENLRSGKKDNVGTNLQNIPYTFNIRKIIKAKSGWSIFEIDYSQIELRFAAEHSKDRLMLQLFNEGKDIHAMRGRQIMGLTEEEWEKVDPKIKKEARQKAKATNFGFLFGMSAKKFQDYALKSYGVAFTSKECFKVREKFFEDHSGLLTYYAHQIHEGERKGYVESLNGRRRHLPDMRLNPDESKEIKKRYQSAVRQSINSPIQGGASDLKIMAGIEIDETLSIEKAYLFGEIHDSLVGEVKNEYIDEVLTTCLKIMKSPKLLKEFGITFSVPIDAEAKVGPSLGETKVYVLYTK